MRFLVISVHDIAVAQDLGSGGEHDQVGANLFQKFFSAGFEFVCVHRLCLYRLSDRSSRNINLCMENESNQFSLNHLTLNTMGAPFKPKVKARYQQTAELIRELCTRVPLDVVTLQEAFWHDHTKGSLYHFCEEHFPYFSFPDDLRGNFSGSGLVTFSKWPIQESRFLKFKKATGSDRFASKGVHLTRLRLAGQQHIDLYNTHLQASYISQKIRSGVRIHQVKEIIDFVKQHSRGQEPSIVTGDLNFDEHNDEYLCLVDVSSKSLPRDGRFLDVMRQLHPDRSRMPLVTLPAIKRRGSRKLDHVLLQPGKNWKWVRSQSQSEVLDWKVSDHFPVLSNLVFVKKS